MPTHDERLEPQWLDTRTAAALIDISPRGLESMRQRGEGPRYSKVGRLVRYRRADIEQWLEQGLQP